MYKFLEGKYEYPIRSPFQPDAFLRACLQLTFAITTSQKWIFRLRFTLQESPSFTAIIFYKNYKVIV
jgi:hypothetical protein